jgi:hypothetical protein
MVQWEKSWTLFILRTKHPEIAYLISSLSTSPSILGLPSLTNIQHGFQFQWWRGGMIVSAVRGSSFH